jgi:phospholipid-binding lipoprotein MlaA
MFFLAFQQFYFYPDPLLFLPRPASMYQSLRQLKFSKTKIIFLIIATFQLFGCATMQVAENENGIAENADQASSTDPYEGFNRTMYDFNHGLDSYILGPVIDGYKWVTPDLLETGISNVFLNMKGINVVLNDFLQGKLYQGAEDTGRFLLNSTVGIAGIFDVATYAGLRQNDEDFGQTLAVWGVPSGPYLVLPVLGPSTVRGVPGSIVDTAANPVSYLAWPVAAMAAVDMRATADSSLQFIDEASIDSYVFTREAYLQHRNYLASDGKGEYSSERLLEEFEDEEDEDLLLDAGNLNIDTIDEQGKEQSLDDVAEAEKKTEAAQGIEDSPKKVETKNIDTDQTQENLPDFEKAKRSFNKATSTYQKASDELEMIKKGDQK